MAIDFKSFLQCAPHVIKVRKPILIRGRHGIGKSEVVYQIAESLDLPVVERYQLAAFRDGRKIPYEDVVKVRP